MLVGNLIINKTGMVFFIISCCFLILCLPVVCVLFRKRLKSDSHSEQDYKEMNIKLLIFEIISIIWGIAFCCSKLGL